MFTPVQKLYIDYISFFVCSNVRKPGLYKENVKTLTELFKIIPHFSLLHIWNIMYLLNLFPKLFLIAFFGYYLPLQYINFFSTFNCIISNDSQSVVCKTLWFSKTLWGLKGQNYFYNGTKTSLVFFTVCKSTAG